MVQPVPRPLPCGHTAKHVGNIAVAVTRKDTGPKAAFIPRIAADNYRAVFRYLA